MCSNNYVYIDDLVYKYYTTDGSITQTEDKIKSLKDFITSMTWLYNELEKKEAKDKRELACLIYTNILYVYYNYMMNEDKAQFVFDQMSVIKKNYLKYKDYETYDGYLKIYMNFSYPVIHSITVNDFIDKIKL
jgi:hypothetical protein